MVFQYYSNFLELVYLMEVWECLALYVCYAILPHYGEMPSLRLINDFSLFLFI